MSPPNKSEWKLIVRKRVNKYWTKSLQEEASQKTTLRHLCTDICTIGKFHPVWRKTPYNKMEVLQAGVREKILVGRYTLQEDTNKYRGSDAPCPLSKVALENLYHFLFVCTELSEAETLIGNILSRAPNYKKNYLLIQTHQNWAWLILVVPLA